MREQESTRSTISSMAFSLFLVGLSVLFLIGCRLYLQHHTYQGVSLAEESTESEEVYVADDSFSMPYLVIKNLDEGEEFCATAEPGVVEEDSTRLSNGQILELDGKGTYKEKEYYHLKDGRYLEADADKVIELQDYLPLSGYLAITYISPGGVRLRSWPEFEADNIKDSVYIGDKVTVIAMVTRADGVTAFRTQEGWYITTDSQYFTDCTNLSELTAEAAEAVTAVPAEEATTEADTKAP